MPHMEGTTIIGWDTIEEEKRVLFMDHMYKIDGRDKKDHPLHGTYTGLWQNFCLNEAGRAMRDQWFERMEAITRDLAEINETRDTEVFIPTFSD
jgi:hypothetical protein